MTNLLSVSNTSSHLKEIVSTFDGDDYSLEHSFEIATEDIYLIGGKAVQAIDEYVEFHGIDSLLTLVGELHLEGYLSVEDYDVESVANLVYYIITDKVFQYVRNLSLNNNSEIVSVLDRIANNSYNEEVATFDGLDVEINDSGDTTFVELLAERYDGHLYFYNGFDEPKALAVNDTIVESNYLGDVTADFLEELRAWQAESDESLQYEQPFVIPFNVWFEPTQEQLQEANVTYGLNKNANLANYECRLKGGESS